MTNRSVHPAPYQRKLAICPMPGCVHKSPNPICYRKHLVDFHNFPPGQLTETFAFDYYIFDIKTDHLKFASVCHLCAKVSNLEAAPTEETSTDDEKKRHVADHMGVLSFKCNDCSTWFKDGRQADRHSTTNHNKKNTILDINGHFATNPNHKYLWTTATLPLIKALNLCIGSIQSNGASDFTDSRDEDLSRIVKQNEVIWHSLSDVKGLLKNVLLTCGDWQQVGKMIQSSSALIVKKSCHEIKDDYEELIMHHRACNSMATLLFNCDTDSWNFLLALLENKHIRSKFYDSFEAGHFFRKIMTAGSFDDERFLNLSIVFKTSELLNKNANSLYFICMAARPGPAALDLARFVIDKISVMGVDQHFHHCIQFLIISASKGLKEKDASVIYSQFLEAVASAFYILAKSNFGLSLLQALTYYSPTFCNSFLKLVTSPEWMFEKVNNLCRYQDGHQTQLIQVAICARSPDEICHLAMILFSNESHDPYLLLLKSHTGNNILRRIISQIGDLTVLQKIAKHISNKLNLLTDIHRNNPKKIAFSKVVVDLASRRAKMAHEKQRQLNSHLN